MTTTTNIPTVSVTLALQFGNWGRNGKLHFSNKVIAVNDLADASAKWGQIRDFEGWGASESPVVVVVNTVTGEQVAKVSYNGRVWDSAGKEIRIGKTSALKWFAVAEYVEEDAHSRDYLKPKLCIVTRDGYTHRGLPVRKWTEVRALNAADAKERVKRGEGIKRS
jgi:hypothetical protein